MLKLNKMNKTADFKFYTKDFEVDTKTSDKRIITGFATTSDVDREFDVISEDAIKGAAEDLLQNPTVFYEHKHSEYPIGKVIDTKIMGGKLLVKVEISKTADQVWTLIQEGILRCFSIGGRFLDFKTIHDKDLNKDIRLITKLELFEVSVVGLPANASAIITDVSKAIVKSLETKQIDELEEKQRGEGQGQDNPRQGDGGADICICPECGYEQEHNRGTPCNEIKCPECGSEMTGKSKENDNDKDIDKESNDNKESKEEDIMDKNLLKVAKESLKDFEAIEKDLELEFTCKGKVVSVEEDEKELVTLQIDEIKKLEPKEEVKEEEAKEEKEESKEKTEEKEDKSVYEILEKVSEKLSAISEKLEEKTKEAEKEEEEKEKKEEQVEEKKEEKKKAKRKGTIENEKELSEEEKALQKIKTMTPTQIIDDTELFSKLPKEVQAGLIKASIRV